MLIDSNKLIKRIAEKIPFEIDISAISLVKILALITELEFEAVSFNYQHTSAKNVNMNDFTKDELEQINTAVSIYEKRIYGNSNETRFTSILRKIGRMIDNYCEHEIDEDEVKYCPGLYTKLIAGNELSQQDLIVFHKCHKCGEFFR